MTKQLKIKITHASDYYPECGDFLKKQYKKKITHLDEQQIGGFIPNRFLSQKTKSYSYISNYSQLNRYFESQVGKLWQDVYSDIVKKCPKNGPHRSYLENHIKFKIDQNVVMVNGIPKTVYSHNSELRTCYGLFVHPETGVLSYWGKENIVKEYRDKIISQGENFIFLEDRRFIKVDNVWMCSFAEHISKYTWQFNSLVYIQTTYEKPPEHDYNHKYPCFKNSYSCAIEYYPWDVLTHNDKMRHGVKVLKYHFNTFEDFVKPDGDPCKQVRIVSKDANQFCWSKLVAADKHMLNRYFGVV